MTVMYPIIERFGQENDSKNNESNVAWVLHDNILQRLYLGNYVYYHMELHGLRVGMVDLNRSWEIQFHLACTDGLIDTFWLYTWLFG